MNQGDYILEESGKIALTANQLACLTQNLLDREVDLAVLSAELTKLADMSTRIIVSIREQVLSLQERELQE